MNPATARSNSHSFRYQSVIISGYMVHDIHDKWSFRELLSPKKVSKLFILFQFFYCLVYILFAAALLVYLMVLLPDFWFKVEYLVTQTRFLVYGRILSYSDIRFLVYGRILSYLDQISGSR